MRQYLELMQRILAEGIHRPTRTGVDTRSVWGHLLRFDLQEGFPLVTTKRVYVHAVLVELLGFIHGITDVGWYRERGCRIWNEWATEAYARERLGLKPGDPGYAEDDLGPIYPHQWRFFGAEYRGPHHPDVTPERPAEYDRAGCVNQLAWVVEQLKTRPHSRQILLSAWNPVQLPYMALPPCHVLIQFEVREGRLCASLYQRSADVFLGVPFNIAQYAFLTHMLAHVTGYEVGTFVHYLADAHLYENHLSQVEIQLARSPRELPRLSFAGPVEDLWDFRYDQRPTKAERRAGRYGDFLLEGYRPHPALRAEVAV